MNMAKKRLRRLADQFSGSGVSLYINTLLMMLLL
jgi:hypothetical protein